MFHRLFSKNKPVEATDHTPEYNIPEVLPIHCRESELAGQRLNLLIPALSLRFSFGGINTALEFFNDLSKDFEDIRIIITDEAVSDLQGLAGHENWQLMQSGDDDRPGKTIVCFGDRYNKTIPVSQTDVFVATAWWTAYNGEKILNWQKETWKKTTPPLVYLIQDFEPGFYKWSSRYLLSLSTYAQKNMVAVVNTTLLHDYIKSTGISFKYCYVFEPTLNRRLSTALQQGTIGPKKKKIIFYGRPSVERNAYELIVKGLELWSFWYPEARNWEITSLGESYRGPALGNGISVNVRGKITIEEYANTLSESAIGISLMVSPHPSYPPLEMAAFGLGVISNTFFNKNLSDYHTNIYSLENVNPENIAKLLAELCVKFESDNNSFSGKSFRGLNFLGTKNTFDFISELKHHLLQKEHLTR